MVKMDSSLATVENNGLKVWNGRMKLQKPASYLLAKRFDYKLTKVKWAGFSGSKFQVDDMSSLCVFLLLKSLFLSLA
ncbi:hypothetical protein IGI04_034365 [Brassica rapa subsp. trilocularis]|uniref:Uncharacterized protein n=1 Tax=Brassica rapa subsp. trilocularis TaxID=1813537 RepID=A0ABQ7LAI5_BRACM|nr:hypothetical protein IGI04_034365 [Brassica rapa subsp. trilocularis]